MQLVQIVLDVNDDPQVIFEVLNHRGVPLDAADLVKNLLFQQFDLGGKATIADDLLLNVWGDLDHLKPWREEVTTGRFKRKRIDVLLSYWLTIEQGEEVLVEHLFADFKTWFTSSPRDATDVIKDIRHHADCMEIMRALSLNDPTGQVLDRMYATQTTTPWPVLLYLYSNPDIPVEQRHIGSKAIDSYLMRRGICRWTGKDYNRLFLTVLNAAKSATPARAGMVVEQMLVSQTADSRRFPTDAEFGEALLVPNLYYVVIRARLKSLLVGIDNHLFNSKVDSTNLHLSNEPTLNIEHLLPQAWTKNWPLSAKPSDAAYDEIKLKRELAVNSLGNLTLLTAKLNGAVSNGKWSAKKKEIQKHSLLLLTTTSVFTPPGNYAQDDVEWDKGWGEDRIATRGEWLRDLAIQVWSRPPPTMYLAEKAAE